MFFPCTRPMSDSFVIGCTRFFPCDWLYQTNVRFLPCDWFYQTNLRFFPCDWLYKTNLRFFPCGWLYQINLRFFSLYWINIWLLHNWLYQPNLWSLINCAAFWIGDTWWISCGELLLYRNDMAIIATRVIAIITWMGHFIFLKKQNKLKTPIASQYATIIVCSLLWNSLQLCTCRAQSRSLGKFNLFFSYTATIA